MASLRDMQCHYSLGDALDLYEIARVDAHNRAHWEKFHDRP